MRQVQHVKEIYCGGNVTAIRGDIRRSRGSATTKNPSRVRCARRRPEFVCCWPQEIKQLLVEYRGFENKGTDVFGARDGSSADSRRFLFQ